MEEGKKKDRKSWTKAKLKKEDVPTPTIQSSPPSAGPSTSLSYSGGDEKDKEKDKEKEKEKEKKRTSWLNRSASSDSSGLGMSSTSEASKRKSWRKGEIMSPQVLAKQRTLEQFLLNYTMKRLRGTAWRYFHVIHQIPLDDDKVIVDNGVVTATVEKSPVEKAGSSSEKGERKDRKEKQEKKEKKDLTPPRLSASPASPGGNRRGSCTPSPQSSKSNVIMASPSQAELDTRETVIFLHSGGVRPEAHFDHILSLASDGFRVVAPWLPQELNEMEDYAAGIFLIMQKENINKAHFFGISFGAMLAQYILYRYPERVLKVVLTNCFPPDESISDKLSKALKKMDFTDPYLLHTLMGYKISAKELDKDIPNIENDEKELWQVILKKFQANKMTIYARTEALIEYNREIQYIPEDFSNFASDSVLIIDSDLVDEQQLEKFEELKTLHKNARKHTFEGTGPMFALLRGETVSQVVSEFLKCLAVSS